MREMIYVSNNALLNDGSENPFFRQEKGWIAGTFGAFTVVCPEGILRYGEDGTAERVRSAGAAGKALALLRGLTDRNVRAELGRMRRDGALRPILVLKLLRYACQGAQMERLIRRAMADRDPGSILLYSFWFSFDAYACARVRADHPELRAVARAHSYEIQLHRNACNPYLMKDYMCAHLDRIAFIAEDAVRSFTAYHPALPDGAAVMYLGSTRRNTGQVEREKKDRLTVVTCSSVVPIKRLDRMIEVLRGWDRCDVHWIHLGDGPLMEKTAADAEEALAGNARVTRSFAGRLDNEAVHARLMDPDVDVFVNMSETEGVPVSIMEAMSAGIPVIAPAICGIPELVDASCGILFDPQDAVGGLRGSLLRFAGQTAEERRAMGAAAYRKWSEHFCLEDNLGRLFDCL